MDTLLSLPKIITRAVYYNLSGSMATRPESTQLKKTPGVVCKGTHNLLVWRRSVIGLSILGMLVIMNFDLQAVETAKVEYNITVNTMNEDIVYDPIGDRVSFRSYTRRVGEATVGERLERSDSKSKIPHILVTNNPSCARAFTRASCNRSCGNEGYYVDQGSVLRGPRCR